jgi:hypothetical protein
MHGNRIQQNARIKHEFNKIRRTKQEFNKISRTKHEFTSKIFDNRCGSGGGRSHIKWFCQCVLREGARLSNSSPFSPTPPPHRPPSPLLQPLICQHGRFTTVHGSTITEHPQAYNCVGTERNGSDRLGPKSAAGGVI